MQGDGFFDFRRIHPSARERRDNWTTQITPMPDGRLLLVWSSTTDTEVSRSNRIWHSFSTDDGETWSPPETLVESTDTEKILNTCCYTHTDGTVFVFFNIHTAGRIDLALQTSTDSAESWGTRRVLDSGAAQTGFLDNPLRLRSGRIVLPVYFNRPRDGAEHWVGSVMISDDDGKTWRRGGEMNVDARRGAMEPTIAELSGGDLYCLIRTTTGFHYECRSPDGGESWSEPTQSPFAGPEANGILRRLANGNLIFVWDRNDVSQGRQTPRYPLCVALSEDDAATWPLQKMIETTYGVKQLANHGVFQTKSGRILVPTSHFQGADDGRTVVGDRLTGHLDMARFDESWIRSRLDEQRWHESPAATGGIRLDADGCLLVSGAANGAQTVLQSRTPLPHRCRIECELTDDTQSPDTYNGIYLGGKPWGEADWLYFARSRGNSQTPAVNIRRADNESRAVELASDIYYESTKVVIQKDGHRVRYSDSNGITSDWVALPDDVDAPLDWGFFSRNAGAQGRLRVRNVRVTR